MHLITTALHHILQHFGHAAPGVEAAPKPGVEAAPNSGPGEEEALGSEGVAVAPKAGALPNENPGVLCRTGGKEGRRGRAAVVGRQWGGG